MKIEIEAEKDTGALDAFRDAIAQINFSEIWISPAITGSNDPLGKLRRYAKEGYKRLPKVLKVKAKDGILESITFKSEEEYEYFKEYVSYHCASFGGAMKNETVTDIEITFAP